MALPIDLSVPALREYALRAATGRDVSAEVTERAFEILEALVDEARAAAEEVDAADDLVGVIERLEKARADAVEEMNAEIDKQRDDYEKIVEEERELRIDMEKTLDEWKRRAELAEHDLAELRAKLGSSDRSDDIPSRRARRRGKP